MFVVLKFNIADVQKPVAPDAKIDECCLNTGFNIDDAALVDIADVIFEAVSFDVKFLQQAIFNDGNPTFLRLKDIHQHFFFHHSPFSKYECAGRLANLLPAP